LRRRIRMRMRTLSKWDATGIRVGESLVRHGYHGATGTEVAERDATGIKVGERLVRHGMPWCHRHRS
jgi:hypothetical protein